MAKSVYVDVNKEKYLQALFRDVQKQNKMLDFDEAKNAKIIHDFVVGNPTNTDDSKSTSGLPKRNGCFVIASRKKSKKSKK